MNASMAQLVGLSPEAMQACSDSESDLTPLFLRLPIPDAANLRIAHEDVHTGGAPLQEQVVAVGDRSSILSPTKGWR